MSLAFRLFSRWIPESTHTGKPCRDLLFLNTGHKHAQKNTHTQSQTHKERERERETATQRKTTIENWGKILLWLGFSHLHNKAFLFVISRFAPTWTFIIEPLTKQCADGDLGGIREISLFKKSDPLILCVHPFTKFTRYGQEWVKLGWTAHIDSSKTAKTVGPVCFMEPTESGVHMDASHYGTYHCNVCGNGRETTCHCGWKRDSRTEERPRARTVLQFTFNRSPSLFCSVCLCHLSFSFFFFFLPDL